MAHIDAGRSIAAARSHALPIALGIIVGSLRFISSLCLSAIDYSRVSRYKSSRWTAGRGKPAKGADDGRHDHDGDVDRISRRSRARLLAVSLARERGTTMARRNRINDRETALAMTNDIDGISTLINQVLARYHECGQSHWTGGRVSDPGDQVDAPSEREQAAMEALRAARDAVSSASHEMIMHAMSLSESRA